MKSEMVFQFGVKEKVGPVVMTKSVYSLSDYALIGTETANCSASPLFNYPHSRYTCIEVLFTFQRTFYTPMTRIFTPTMFLLILSWIPFFLRGSPQGGDKDCGENAQKGSPPGGERRNNSKITFFLSLSSLLALIFLVNQININGPTIDTTNARDIWTGVCITLSFLAFVNVCIIEFLDRKKTQNSTSSEPWTTQSINRRRSLNHVHFEKDSESVTVEKETKEEKKEEVVLKKEPKDPDEPGLGLDSLRKYVLTNQVRSAIILGQFLHPIVFLLFNLIYWTCLARSGVVATS